MNHNSSNTADTEEIEFTIAYGTAVAMIGKRQSTPHSRQPEASEASSGNVTSRLDTAILTVSRPR